MCIRAICHLKTFVPIPWFIPQSSVFSVVPLLARIVQSVSCFVQRLARDISVHPKVLIFITSIVFVSHHDFSSLALPQSKID
jgi:hypothetical protein